MSGKVAFLKQLIAADSINLKLVVELIALTQSRFFGKRLIQTVRFVRSPPDSADQNRQEKHKSPENVS